MRIARHPALLVALLPALVSCGQPTGSDPVDASTSTCAQETRADTYVPGISRKGMAGIFSLKLMSSTPAPPAKGNNDWLVEILDAQDRPAEGLTVTALPFMPDHGHGTSIKVAVTAMGGGTYKLWPVNLFMSGLWEVTVTATSPDMKTDYAVFSFCIEG